MSAPLLVADRLSLREGDAQVLLEVSLAVQAGAGLAVLGSNGSGKSAIGHTICGLRRGSGDVTFDGVDITGWSAQRIRRLGLVYLPAGRGLFPGLSVIDNLRMGVRCLGGRREQRAAIDAAFERFPILKNRQKQTAGSLSGGEQQMLSLARALGGRPKLIIADEISLGLAPKVVDSVFEELAAAVRDGVALVLIEQYIERALALADNCIILQRGSVQWSGPSADAHNEVTERYLGSTLESADPE